MTPQAIKPWIELARLAVQLTSELVALARSDAGHTEAQEAGAAALAAIRGRKAGEAAAASSAAASSDANPKRKAQKVQP